MKLQLAYNNELELTNLPTFNGRVSYIKQNILNNDEYITSRKQGKNYTFEEFYNMNSDVERTAEELKQIRNRWLGVKRVGSPNKDESFKLTFNMIASYLLNSKDYSAKSEIHDFKKLKRKQYDSSIDDEETKQLKKIEKNILFHKISTASSDEEDIVFYFNRSFESMLKRRVKENPDNVEQIKDKIAKCKQIRMQVNRKAKKYNEIVKYIETVKMLIKSDYQLLKEDKNNKVIMKEITHKIKTIRKQKKQLYYLEVDLNQLTSDYILETELVTNNH